MRLAVVGHVEWVEFVRVERVPRAGEIVTGSDAFAEPAGGGGGAAVQLARLADDCTLYTALGDDDLGHRAFERLGELGVRVEAAWRKEPQREAFTFTDAAGERTITVIGDKLVARGSDPLPWGELADADGVFFVAGDEAALGHARGARLLTATPRELATLAPAAIPLDVVVGSGQDPAERCSMSDFSPEPELLVQTAGSDGGEYWERGGGTRRYAAVSPPAPIADSYGAGDTFAAALTFALARGDEAEDALAFAARAAAVCITGRGPYEADVSSA